MGVPVHAPEIFFRIWNGGKIHLFCFPDTDFDSYWMRLRGSYLFLMSLIFAFVDLVDKVAFGMLKNGFEEKQLAAFKILKENFLTIFDRFLRKLAAFKILKEKMF